MGTPDKCNQCGASLSESSMGGLCPVCTVRRVVGFVADPGTALDMSVPSQVAGAAFGEFELMDEIGRGGMGIVYKARERRLKRLVALKMILHGLLADDLRVRRFRAEARAAASLRHPNILTIHGMGDVEGQHYFYMDLIEGPNLANLVREGPLTPKQAATLMRDVGRAVQYAHEQGVIHRDLKPANIILDPEGRPHVADFGLAKRMGEDSDLTRSGQMVGSPNFAAPEQARGGGQDVQAAADIFALGAILYFLIVGRPPFQAETLEQTLAMVIGTDPVPPRTLNPGIPIDLETVCLKCLEKEPDKRYKTAGHFADDLERFLDGSPIQARPVGRWGRATRWCQRNPVMAGLWATAAVLFLAGLSGVFWQWQRAEQFAQEERQQRGRAERTVTQLKLERSGDLLMRDAPGPAAAYLADVLRNEPTNTVAALRLMTLLSHRNFALRTALPLSHDSRVTDLDFDAEGKRVATASEDGRGRLWAADSGALLGELAGHQAGLTAIRFSPDGQRLATASRDKTVRLWSSTNAAPILSPLPHNGPVTGLEFNGDGTRLLAVSADRTVFVWDTVSGRPLGEPMEHQAVLSAAHWSPNGDVVLTSTLYEGLLRLWDAGTGQLIGEPFGGGSSSCWSARFSPDGGRVVSTHINSKVILWDVDTREMVGRPFSHAGQATDAEFSPDSRFLVATCSDGTAHVWNLHTGRLAYPPLRHRTWVRSAQIVAQGRILLTVAKNNTAHVWDLASGNQIMEPIRLPHMLTTVRLSQDGNRLATASEDGHAQLWDLPPESSRPLQLPHRWSVWYTQFSPDSRQLLSADGVGDAKLWDVETGEMVCPILSHDKWILRANFDPSGNRVITGGDDLIAFVWDTGTGSNLLRIAQHRNRLSAVSFSPDGQRILTGSFDGTAGIWDASSGEPTVPLLTHSARLWDAQFSPDGSRVGTACRDQFARIWDSRTGALLLECAHEGEVRQIAFSPDNRWFVTASEDNTARVWDLDSGRQVHELRHAAPLTYALFSSDGRWIATASRDNTARLWDASSGSPVGEPMEHQGEVTGIAFSPDLTLVATVATGQPVSLWAIPSTMLVADSFRLRGSSMTVSFSPDGRWLAAGSEEKHVRVWEVPHVRQVTPEWWIDLAEAVAGQRLHEEQTLQPSPPDALVAARTNMGTFTEEEPFQQWTRWLLAGRHQRTVSPRSNIKIASQQKVVHRRDRISERVSGTPDACLDLSLYYNAELQEDWHGEQWRGNNLATFKAGLHTLGGVPFDVRGVLQLNSRALEYVTRAYPRRVAGIPVGRTVSTIHVLHGTGWGNDDPRGTTIGHYVLHYVDGEIRKLPVMTGKDLLEWQFNPANLDTPSEAVEAWRGVNGRGTSIRLFQRAWKNPRPNVAIEILTVESTMTKACPFLLAITLDP